MTPGRSHPGGQVGHSGAGGPFGGQGLGFSLCRCVCLCVESAVRQHRLHALHAHPRTRWPWPDPGVQPRSALPPPVLLSITHSQPCTICTNVPPPAQSSAPHPMQAGLSLPPPVLLNTPTQPCSTIHRAAPPAPSPPCRLAVWRAGDQRVQCHQRTGAGVPGAPAGAGGAEVHVQCGCGV